MVPLVVVAVAVVVMLMGALAVVVVVVAGAVAVVVVVLVLLVVVFGRVAVVVVIVAVVVHIVHALQDCHVHFLDHGMEFLVHQNLHLGVSVTAAGVDGCGVVVVLEVARRSNSLALVSSPTTVI